MKQFGTILRFELSNFLKNKALVGSTVFLVIVLAVVMFFPKISALFQSNDESGDSGEASVMLVYAEDAELAELTRQYFSEAFEDYDVQAATGSLDEIKAQISAGDAECAFVLDSPSSYTYYVENRALNDSNVVVADRVLQEVYRVNALIRQGVSPEQAAEIMGVQIESRSVSLGKDQGETYWYTYIMIMALYMLLLIYGQMVATNVASEKSSRAMELLVTSAKPAGMMFGKVLASCLAGLLQLAVVFGAALLFYRLSQADWADSRIIELLFHIPLHLFVFMLVFFVLGFLIFAFLYGAVGSMASKMEDVSTLIMPMTFVLMIAFMVVLFSMVNGSMDGALMKVCSFIPFTAPMAMFARICMSTVPWQEIAISIVILLGSTVGVGFLAAKIYRVGVLLYGTTPKPGAILKAIRSK